LYIRNLKKKIGKRFKNSTNYLLLTVYELKNLKKISKVMLVTSVKTTTKISILYGNNSILTGNNLYTTNISTIL